MTEGAISRSGIAPTVKHQRYGPSVRTVDRSVSRIVETLLYLYFILFSASNVYDSSISQMLTTFKWVPLLLVAMILFVKTMNKDRSALYASGNLIPLLIIFFLSFSTFLNDNFFASISVLISLILTMWVALYLGGSYERLTKTLLVLRNVGMLTIASAAVFYVAGINLGRGQPRFSGWVDNPNTLAMLIVPTLVIVLWQLMHQRSNRIFLSFVLAAGFWVLIESGSRASMGWLAVSASILLLLRIKSHLVVIVGALTVMIVAAGSDIMWERSLGAFSRAETASDVQLLSGRDEVWAFARERIQEKPVFGYGSGSSESLVKHNYFRFLHHSGDQIHSSYLTAAVEGGLVVASIMVMAMMIGAWSAFAKARVKTSTIIRRNQRDLYRLSFALLAGAAFHGLFETWILSAGNPNTLWFWALVLGSISLRVQSKSRRSFD